MVTRSRLPRIGSETGKACEICGKITSEGRYFNVKGMGRVWECRECANRQARIFFGGL